MKTPNIVTIAQTFVFNLPTMKLATANGATQNISKKMKNNKLAKLV